MVIQCSFSTCKRWFLIALLGSITMVGNTIHAQVQATLSAVSISEHDAVTLTIKDTIGDSGEPDFSLLNNDFDLSNTQSSNSYTFSNGNFHRFREWSVMLYPKRTGTIEIPAFDIGGNFTNSLKLEVRRLSSQERNFVNKTAFFETIVSHDEQYLQAAIYVTRRMFYTAQTRIPAIPAEKPLTVENAVVRTLGSRESATEVRNNISYYVMTWRYVIFPEKSGELLIPGESTRVAMYSNNQRPVVRAIIAEEKRIKILPIPTEYPRDEPWLPASNLTLTESFEPDLTVPLHIGDALTRTIEVAAENSFDSTLTPLDLGEIDNLRVYPEQPKRETVLQNQVVWATQERTFNLIPIQPGIVNLPPFKLTWFDVETRQVRTATLNSADIRVPAILSGDRGMFDSGETEPIEDVSQNLSPQSSSTFNVWFYALTGFAILGWLLVFALLIQKQIKSVSNAKIAKNPDRKVDYQSIRSAVATKDASTLRAALLNTVAMHLNINVVQARALVRRSDAGRQLVDRLDKMAYGQSNDQFDFEYRNIKQLIDYIEENQNENRSEFGLDAILDAR